MPPAVVCCSGLGATWLTVSIAQSGLPLRATCYYQPCGDLDGFTADTMACPGRIAYAMCHVTDAAILVRLGVTTVWCVRHMRIQVTQYTWHRRCAPGQLKRKIATGAGGAVEDLAAACGSLGTLPSNPTLQLM